MKHTVRDVALLGAAMSAFMLLVVLAPVGAEELPAAEATATEARVAASATSEAEVRLAANRAPAKQRQAATEATSAAESQAADRPATDTGTVERGCDHVRRIGKFTVTRCD